MFAARNLTCSRAFNCNISAVELSPRAIGVDFRQLWMLV